MYKIVGEEEVQLKNNGMIRILGNNCWICDYCNYCSSNFLDFIHLGGGKHICPYGCGRMIPDGYQGCTELLKEFPNYAF